MTTINIIIDDQNVSVPEGTSIWAAAEKLGIEIPTLCFLKDYEIYTSCMICMVQDKNNARLVPSCSTPVYEGLVVETNNEKIHESRKDTLDLLLSEHIGDCDGPCQRICPAFMDIPLMIRQIEKKDYAAAIKTVKADIALPAILGRICPAPCEKGCNRNHYDEALSICLLKRFVADMDLESDKPYQPECAPATGKKIAIIGAGPTGLAAAYYCKQFGHDVVLYDKNPQPGGLIRSQFSNKELPVEVIDKECQMILDLGVEFVDNTELGTSLKWGDLQSQYDAIVLAMGVADTYLLANLGLETTNRGIKADKHTFQTNLPKIFAGGSVVAERKMAVRSVADGKSIAISVDQFLSGKSVTGRTVRFNSVIGRLQAGEGDEYNKECDNFDRHNPAQQFAGLSETGAINETTRCFHCDCRKPDSCKLRLYCDEYGADQKRFKTATRSKIERNIQHEFVVFEPGKCIKCGICVRITEKAAEKYGLTFIGRGFDVRVHVPLNEPMSKGLEKVAKQCVNECPTAALSFKNYDEHV